MSQLLQAYLPLVIFVGIAFAISAALLDRAFLHRAAQSRSGESFGL